MPMCPTCGEKWDLADGYDACPNCGGGGADIKVDHRLRLLLWAAAGVLALGVLLLTTCSR
ncbi:MAG: hypothetical protein HGB10_11315 [Coriobacteriia bacterium]|nr:hypothetical protein [Coriobacteriia bacterium]